MPSHPPILLFGRIIPPPSDSPRSVADLPLSSLAQSTSDDEEPAPIAQKPILPSLSDVAPMKPAQMDPRFPSPDVESPPRKPDQLVPCPRCHNLDTKFCYFNNYNVKQPRHFCRSCQRYWTAGGTLRNVPVGAGRRRNKNPVNPTKPHPDVVSPRSDHPGSAQRLHEDQAAHITNKDSNQGLHAPLIDLINSTANCSAACGQRPLGSSSEVLRSGLENFREGKGEPKKPEIQGAEMGTRPKQELGIGSKQELRCSSSLTERGGSEAVSGSEMEGGGKWERSCAAEGGLRWANPVVPMATPWPYMGMMGWPGLPSLQNQETVNGPWPEGFFPFPAILAPVWTPYGFTMPWNFAWNNAATALGKHHRMPTTAAEEQKQEDDKEGSLCCPKARRIHEEVATYAHAFQPLTAHHSAHINKQFQHHHHSNPAAQARSLAFREGSS